MKTLKNFPGRPRFGTAIIFQSLVLMPHVVPAGIAGCICWPVPYIRCSDGYYWGKNQRQGAATLMDFEVSWFLKSACS